MRAVQLTGFGGLDKLDYRENVPDPEPGPDEVRVRVGATGINNTDIWTRQGAYGAADDPDASAGWRREPLTFPRIQGADVAGRIDQVGRDVDESRIGERVLVDPMLYDGDERALVSTEYLGSERDGGFAEYVTVPARNAHVVDGPLSDTELATFPTAYATAMRMLNRAEVGPGETVLVTGASGGVGSALIQLATIRGARVIAVVGKGKEARARDLGAADAILRDELASVSDDAVDVDAVDVDAVDVDAVDVVADVVAGPSFPALLRALRPLGRYVVAGAIAGPLVETDLRTVYLKQLRLVGSSFGSHDDFAQLLTHIRNAELTPLLAGTYPLRELRTAQEAFMAKAFFGKLVVVPESAS